MATPHKISTLLYGFNDRDETLLLQRSRPPNQGLWSPCGGKLNTDEGESPHACACREAFEETGLRQPIQSPEWIIMPGALPTGCPGP